MISKDICDLFCYDENVVNNYLKNKKTVSELKFLENYDKRRFIHKMSPEEKEAFDIGYSILKDSRKDIDISYENFSRNKIKIDGQERKLFRYLNDSALSEEVGKYKLPNRELYLVISINPEDMLMCSTKQPWTSCTNLEKGDFKFTTISNLFVNGRFIVYITDLKEITYKGLESYNMLFRAFGFVGEDGKLYTNIWYPIRKNIGIKAEDIEVHSVDKKIKSKYNIDKVFNKLGSFVSPYIDFGEVYKNGNKELSFLVQEEYIHFYPNVYFNNSNETVRASSYYWYGTDNALNSIKRKCDICGSNKGYIQTHGDKNYCVDCFNNIEEECCMCGHKTKTFNFTEDNKWICDDCLKNLNIKKCSICGTTIRMKNKTECKYCRSVKTDAFKNITYEYFDKEKNNVRDYFRHYYVNDEKGLPPGIKEDEEFFEEKEMYVKR